MAFVENIIAGRNSTWEKDAGEGAHATRSHHDYRSEADLAFGYAIIGFHNVVEFVGFSDHFYFPFRCDVEGFVEIFRGVLRRADEADALEHELGSIVQRLGADSHQDDPPVRTHALCGFGGG